MRSVARSAPTRIARVAMFPPTRRCHVVGRAAGGPGLARANSLTELLQNAYEKSDTHPVIRAWTTVFFLAAAVPGTRTRAAAARSRRCSPRRRETTASAAQGSAAAAA